MRIWWTISLCCPVDIIRKSKSLELENFNITGASFIASGLVPKIIDIKVIKTNLLNAKTKTN